MHKKNGMSKYLANDAPTRAAEEKQRKHGFQKHFTGSEEQKRMDSEAVSFNRYL